MSEKRMSMARILELVAEYDNLTYEHIQEAGPSESSKKVFFISNEFHKFQEWLQLGERERAVRFLGFMQGVLWALDLLSTRKFQEDNRRLHAQEER